MKQNVWVRFLLLVRVVCFRDTMQCLESHRIPFAVFNGSCLLVWEGGHQTNCNTQLLDQQKAF